MSKISLKGLLLKDEKPNKVRQDGFVPCNLYGNKIKNQKFKVRTGDLIKVYREAGESSLIELQIEEGEILKCLFKEVQLDVITGDFLHVDFYQVDMKEKVTTEIPLILVGESDAIKNLNGVLNANISEIEVECLPDDLVGEIEVDISVLETFEDNIRIEDLKMPSGVVSTLDPKEIVANVSEIQEEVEEEEVEQSVDDVEVSTEKKEEENTEDKKGEDKK